MTVLDLGAAPGGWSQVAAQKVMPGGRVIAIDVLEMAPISGVNIIKGDFRQVSIENRADVVLSDVSPNLSGIANVDQARLLELGLSAIELCAKVAEARRRFRGQSFPRRGV